MCVVRAHPRRHQARRRDCRRRHANAGRQAMTRPVLAAPMDRRAFIKAGSLVGGGLLVGTYLNFGAEEAAAAPLAPVADFAPNVFISIAPTGAITIIAPNSE